MFEWFEPAEGKYKNPYDPEEVAFGARFTGPDGTETDVPGFYFQDYEIASMERLLEEGEPQWCVRFAPPKPGEYRFRAFLKTKSGTRGFPEQKFTVAAGNDPGFVRNDSPNHLYFHFDDGKPYFPLGVAFCWTSRDRLLLDYRDYLDKLASAKGNFTRVWTCEWNLPLEWTENRNAQGTVSGLGHYSQDNSWRLDRVLEMAAERGIYVLLTLDSYGQLMEEKGPWGEQAWERNPYNRKNGGPCRKPWDFFTDKNARKLYQQRLRYVAARWGYCTHLFAFELWNEVKAPPEWVGTMAGYLRRTDPNRHLVANSIGFPWEGAYDEDALLNLTDVGYSQTHYYGGGSGVGDLGEYVFTHSTTKAPKYGKPFFFEEIGLDSMTDDIKADPDCKGTHLHNAFWASAVGMSGGVPLSHWKEYVDKCGLYRELSYIRPFLDALDRGGQTWEPLELEVPVADGGREDLVIRWGANWGEEKRGELITVSPDGKVEGALNRYLRTILRDDQKAPRITLDVPEGCRMVLHVDQVSMGADLRVTADGREIWRKHFDPSPAPGGDGEYKSTDFQQQYGIYFGNYQKDYAIDLPEGRHEIVLENSGKDWISLKSITFTGYTRGSRIKLYGMRSEGLLTAWIQDKKNVWSRAYKPGAAATPLRKGIVFEVPGLAPGSYQVQWWDTYSGKVLSEGNATIGEGPYKLTVPAFKKDVAFIIRRQASH